MAEKSLFVREDKTRRILLVDDDEDIRESLRTALEHDIKNVHIRTAGSAEAAAADLRQERADLVISDYRMPGLSGIDLLREIKHGERLPSSILITAYPSPELAEMAINDAHVDAFFTKPFDLASLEAKIETLLRTPRSGYGRIPPTARDG